MFACMACPGSLRVRADSRFMEAGKPLFLASEDR